MKNVKKLIAFGIVSMSILALNPIKAHAEWKQDNQGWWYTEGNAWATGWRNINNNWYYFNNYGYMVTNTNVNGYYINNNGVWVQNTSTTATNTISNLNSNNNTTTTNNMNSNNTTNSNNNINTGIIINGNISIGNTTNIENNTIPTNTQPNNNTDNSNNGNNDSNTTGDKTDPIIEGKFTDEVNNIFPCWTIIGGKYYHLDKDKRIDYNVTIDGYVIGSDGAWIQDNSITPPNAIVLPYGFQLSAKQIIQNLQYESKVDDLRQEGKDRKHASIENQIKELQNKIADIKKNNYVNGDYWINIYKNQIKKLELEDESLN